MKNYTSPQTKILSGKSIGFPLLDRLSTLFVKSAQRIDWHAHGETEILCCLKGAPTYEFKDRASIALSAGCFMVIPVGIEHRLIGGIDGPCRRLSVFIREPRARITGSSPVSTAEMRELLALLLRKRLHPHIIQNSAFLQVSRLANLLDTAQRPSLVERLTARSDALSAILTMATAHKPSGVKSETRLMKEAVEWLQRHFAEQVTMDQLIAYMGYSRSRLFNLFKSYTGQSPIDWLTQFRIDKARHFLEATDLSIGAIARSCGFTDPAFFARSFRRRVGNSPTAFRKSQRALSN